MVEEVHRVIQSIHAHTGSHSGNAMRLCVLCCGGGASAIAYLLAGGNGGASTTVIECAAPHAREAVLEYVRGGSSARAGGEDVLGGDGFVSAKAASAMARAALRRGISLATCSSNVMGIAATCALASSSEKKGSHRCFIAAQHPKGRGLWSLKLEKGRRTRWEEDNLTSLAIVKTAASLYSSLDDATIKDDIELELSASESFEGTFQKYSVDDAIRLILSPQDLDELPAEAIEIEASASKDDIKVFIGQTRASMLLPGSFNPIHYGHRRLLQAARLMTPGNKVESGQHELPSAAYELSVSNPDKGLLSSDDVRKRVDQFIAADETVVLTRCPLYSDKGRVLQGSTFVLGYDTAIRVVDPKYYNGEGGLIQALSDLRSKKCQFIVGGRIDKSGEWKDLSSIKIPIGFEDMFIPLPLDAFREDVSSTELRQRGEGLE